MASPTVPNIFTGLLAGLTDPKTFVDKNEGYWNITKPSADITIESRMLSVTMRALLGIWTISGRAKSSSTGTDGTDSSSS